MTYLQLYQQIELANKICDDDYNSLYTGCDSCPYVMDEDCRFKLWEDINRLKNALESLGEIPEN